MYLYRAIDSVGGTVEFWFSEQRDLPSRVVSRDSGVTLILATST